MKCNECGNELIPEEIKGTLGIRASYCCKEYQIDLDSLRPKVRESVKYYNQFYNQLYWEIMKDSD